MRIKHWQRIAVWTLVLLVLASLGRGVGGSSVIWAQDGGTPDPTPTDEPEVSGETTESQSGQSVIEGYRSELLFPAMIRLFLTVNVSSDTIETLQVSVAQADGLDDTFTLEPETAVIEGSADGMTVFMFNWDLSASPIPQPFETVRYEWEIATVNDDVFSVEDAFMFADTDAGPWDHAGEPPVTLHWNTPRLAGNLLREDAMMTYRLLRDHTGRTVPFEAALYDAETIFCDADAAVRSVVDATEYACSAAQARDVYERAGIALIQRRNAGYMPVLDQIIIRMVRNTYASFWDGVAIPAWFDYGLGAHYRQYPDLAALQYTRSLAQADVLYGMDRLIEGLPESAHYLERALWAAQSYLLVMYLVDEYGPDAPVELAQTVGEETDFEAALEMLTDGDQAALMANWRDWLSSEAAENAVRWTPYQE